jgi:hypothetical protein
VCIDPRGDGSDRLRMAFDGCCALPARQGDETNTLPAWRAFTNTQILDSRIEIAETADCRIYDAGRAEDFVDYQCEAFILRNTRELDR